MKLDRNINSDGKGKYALIKLREVQLPLPATPHTAMVPVQAIQFGDNPETDFFVIKLKDRFAGPALRAYARAISDYITTIPEGNPMIAELTEYHHEIIRLAEEAHRNPCKKLPD